MTVSQLISQLQHIQAANDYDDMEVVAEDDFVNWFQTIDSVCVTERNADDYSLIEPVPNTNTRRVVCLNLS